MLREKIIWAMWKKENIHRNTLVYPFKLTFTQFSNYLEILLVKSSTAV